MFKYDIPPRPTAIVLSFCFCFFFFLLLTCGEYMERDHLWVTDDEHNSTIQIPKQTGSKTKNIVIHVKLTSTGVVLVSYMYLQLLTVRIQCWVDIILVIDSITV